MVRPQLARSSQHDGSAAEVVCVSKFACTSTETVSFLHTWTHTHTHLLSTRLGGAIRRSNNANCLKFANRNELRRRQRRPLMIRTMRNQSPVSALTRCSGRRSSTNRAADLHIDAAKRRRIRRCRCSFVGSRQRTGLRTSHFVRVHFGYDAGWAYYRCRNPKKGFFERTQISADWLV